MIARIWLSFLK